MATAISRANWEIAMSKWVPTNYIDVGERIRFTERVYAGSFLSSVCLGERIIDATVLHHGQGVKTQRQTFTLKVNNSSGEQALANGEIIRRRSATVYRICCKRLENELDDEIRRFSSKDKKSHTPDMFGYVPVWDE